MYTSRQLYAWNSNFNPCQHTGDNKKHPFSLMKLSKKSAIK
jgi:hypothetical protein